MSIAQVTQRPLPHYVFLQSHSEVPLLDIIEQINQHIHENPYEPPSHFHDWVGTTIFPKFTGDAFFSQLKAAQLIEGTGIYQKSLKDLQPSELLALIMQLFTFIDPAIERGYRDSPIQVFNSAKLTRRSDPKKKEFFIEHWENYFKKTSTAEYNTWKLMRKRVYDDCFETERIDMQANTDEKDFLIKHGFMTEPFADHENLQQQAKQFARDLHEKLNNEEDIFKLMAFAHCGLVKLHTKSDANGRTARLLMHLIGWEKGQLPILIEDFRIYDSHGINEEALVEDLRKWAHHQDSYFNTLSPLTLSRIESIYIGCIEALK